MPYLLINFCILLVDLIYTIYNAHCTGIIDVYLPSVR